LVTYGLKAVRFKSLSFTSVICSTAEAVPFQETEFSRTLLKAG
jgi:hypothetical protein